MNRTATFARRRDFRFGLHDLLRAAIAHRSQAAAFRQEQDEDACPQGDQHGAIGAREPAVAQQQRGHAQAGYRRKSERDDEVAWCVHPACGDCEPSKHDRELREHRADRVADVDVTLLLHV